MKQFWLLISVAFALFFIASAFDKININGFELKSSELYSSMFKIDKENDEQIDTSLTNATRPVDKKIIFPQPLDSAKKSILFIGDSMLEGLSPRLAAYVKENGHTLNTVIWYSSTTEIWGKCDTLTHFIKKFKPNYIFICLGANELFVKDIKTKRAKYVNHILAEIDTIPYLWIGPPNWKKDTGINELLQERLSKGNFFLSDGMHFDRSKDGAHPTRQSAALWMDSVARWMPANSLRPIMLNTPSEKTARTNRVVVLQPAK